MTAACGESEKTATATADQVRGVSDTEIVIGSHNDLSGPTSTIGVPAMNGARMKLAETNAGGGVHGRNIRLVVEDAQYQIPRAIQATNKLVNRDHIFAMFGAMGTPMNNAVMPMLFKKNIPNMFPSTAARSMAKPFRKLQFTYLGTYYQQVQAGIRYFFEEGGATKACVAYQDTDFGQEILEGAQHQLASMGLEAVVTSAHKPTDTEFTATIIRLQNAGCDLVLMGTIYRDTVLILEAARKMGWTDVQWFGTIAAFSYAIAELESGAAEGFAVFQSVPPLYRDDPGLSADVAAWWDQYVDQFGVQPEWGAFQGYRATELLVQGLENAGRTLTVDSFIAGMEEISGFQDRFGISSSFEPDDHNAADKAILTIVKDGRWQTMSQSITYQDQ